MNVKRNHTILCVDDDAEDLELLRHALKTVDADYEIIEAHNGEDALQLLQEMKESGNLPCLIVLDINMPKIDGKQTLVAIQSDNGLSNVPVVIFTTSSSALDKMFFSKRNVEFLTKPVEFDTFFNVASRLLSYCTK